ncbi:MAG TPA: cbb3-type cytochrome c oxidase subunit I [Candidatus Micrarchaeia archaeon]|nr:cbb3-type cytochrome c oxidase subunit I [Candidatus Micrarchaeia archaeon]
MSQTATLGGRSQAASFSPRRLFLSQNLLTATIIGIVTGLIGYWLGAQLETTDNGDAGILLGYLVGSVGFLVGLGFANELIPRLLGRPVSVEVKADAVELEAPSPRNWTRYFGISLDHKVVGIQFGVGVVFLFFVAGFQAMMIRTELLHPKGGPWPAGQYTALVGLHGLLMMFVATLVIVATFGNYFVPLMIGAKRMAFPRLEALAFWLVPLAAIILYSSIFQGSGGGFPTGWTGYAPLAVEARAGMDGYIVGFSFIGIAATIAGINLLTTIFTMRAPGMSWSRLPIFVWAMVAVEFLSVLAPPVLATTLALVGLDRSVQSSFFLPSNGGSAFLYQEMFWFFGHPEVYIFVIPAFGIALEILPVFARKPLFGYRLAVAGMVGVAMMSWFVWNHHIFESGIAPGLRPFFMTATEFISIPTGVVFLNLLGTIWRAKIQFKLPMLFVAAFFFNFLIGGLTGVFLSDVPLDVTLHGGFFVVGHFHYTIVGGEIFSLYAATYYWFPKLTGKMLNERLGKLHFWTAFIFFNTTFLPFFAVGYLGQPRRVPVYLPSLQALNVWISVNAFLFGFSNLIWLVNIIYSWAFVKERAPLNPWNSRSLEWQLPTPIPADNFQRIPTIVAGPYEYGNPTALPVAEFTPGTAPVPAS